LKNDEVIDFLTSPPTDLSYGENPEFLSDLAVIWYRVMTPPQTDGQTDRIPIANTRSQQYLPVQLSCVKMFCMWSKP